MARTVHYVGMDMDTYRRARLVFGGPAYYHRWMDDRVFTEVGDSDMVVIDNAKKSRYVWDASAVDRSYTMKNETFLLSKQQDETAVIAMEEMAELIQVLSKAMRFGYTPGDTGKRLVQEMGDVRLLLELLQNTFGIEDDEIYLAMESKKAKLMAWSSLYE